MNSEGQRKASLTRQLCPRRLQIINSCQSALSKTLESTGVSHSHAPHFPLNKYSDWWKFHHLQALCWESERQRGDVRRSEQPQHSTYSDDMKEDKGPTSFAFCSACFSLNAASASSSSWSEKSRRRVVIKEQKGRETNTVVLRQTGWDVQTGVRHEASSNYTFKN